MTGETKRSPTIAEDLEWATGVCDRGLHTEFGASASEDLFLLDMSRRFERWGADTYVSAKQRAWLERIDERIKEREADEDNGGVVPLDEEIV